MNKLLTNFKKREKEEMLHCLRIANITNFCIEEAFDCFGNPLDDCYGLHIPEEDFEEKKYNIEVYHRAYNLFKNTLYEEYKKRGYDVSPSNISELCLDMEEEELASLCER